MSRKVLYWIRLWHWSEIWISVQSKWRPKNSTKLSNKISSNKIFRMLWPEVRQSLRRSEPTNRGVTETDRHLRWETLRDQWWQWGRGRSQRTPTERCKGRQSYWHSNCSSEPLTQLLAFLILILLLLRLSYGSTSSSLHLLADSVLSVLPYGIWIIQSANYKIIEAKKNALNSQWNHTSDKKVRLKMKESAIRRNIVNIWRHWEHLSIETIEWFNKTKHNLYLCLRDFDSVSID